MYYSVYLQEDGNMVAYLDVNSQTRFDLPLWHTNTYFGSPKASNNKKRDKNYKKYDEMTRKNPSRYNFIDKQNYKCELNNSGDFIIYDRFIFRDNLKRTDTAVWVVIWDSSKDSIDRIV